jgi:hypothetical protein
MGLKIRRLKGGFAYYAEYKLGRHCIYEKIQAGSAREAKRIYAARDKELRNSIPKEARTSTVKQARDKRVTDALSAMLRKLIDKHVISEAEAIELLPEFVSLNPPEPGAEARHDVRDAAPKELARN